MAENEVMKNEDDFVWDGNLEKADVLRELRRDAEKAGDRELAQLYDEEERKFLE